MICNGDALSKVDRKEFLKLVRSKYLENPYRISGFAFWKIEKQINKATTFQVKHSNNEGLFAITNGKLVFYWAEDAKPFMIPLRELKEFQLLSLHHRYGYAIEALKESHNINEYRPMSYKAELAKNEKTNDKIRIVTLNPQNIGTLSEIASIINESTGGKLTPKSIKTWAEITVFDSDLWIGAVNKKTNDLVGVGISTYNAFVQETDLDWFYIRRDYQGQHIGTMLVHETISRCKKRSRVIRVAGMVDEFYKKCGFVQKDAWYYLTEKSTNVGWWD